MPKFSKFSIWEQAVQQFLTEVCENMTRKKKDEVRNWCYSEGVGIFQSTQRNSYQQYEEASLNERKIRPFVDMSYMKAQKFEGFLALGRALQKKFITDEDDITFLNMSITTLCMDSMLTYDDFYKIQVKITNELNKFLDEQDSLKKIVTPADKFNKVYSMFLSEKQNNPNLGEQIDAHLLMLKESCGNMSPQHATTSTQQNEEKRKRSA